MLNNGQFHPEFIEKKMKQIGANGNFELSEFTWFSTTDPLFSANSVANVWNGWLTTGELQKLGDSVQITGSGAANDPTALPYPSVLRPLMDYSILTQKRFKILVGVEFVAFDATVSGSSYQNATVNTAIINSVANTTGSYVITKGLNAIPITWADNLFRPQIFIGGAKNVLNNVNSTPISTPYNKGILSMGYTLPYSIYPYRPYPDQIIDTIEINAACGQFVTTGGQTYVKRYPLMASLLFAYSD